MLNTASRSPPSANTTHIKKPTSRARVRASTITSAAPHHLQPPSRRLIRSLVGGAARLASPPAPPVQRPAQLVQRPERSAQPPVPPAWRPERLDRWRAPPAGQRARRQRPTRE